MAERKGMFGDGREDRHAHLPSEEEILQRAEVLRLKRKPRVFRRVGRRAVEVEEVNIRQYRTDELFGVLRESQSE